MSSIDIHAVTGPASLPQSDLRQPAGSRRAAPIAVRYVGRAVLVGIALALAAAIVPVAAIYSFIWLAQG